MKNVFFIQKTKIPEDWKYTNVPNIIWISDLNLEDKVMLGYLLSHKDKFPINNTYIANSLGVSRKFVIDSTKRLKEKGIIRKENRKLSIFLANIKCNPKLQLSVTQSYTNNTINKTT